MRTEEQLHPQTRRHLVNNERLRSSAIKEFALHGLTGAKVSNIVANAELTQPSFYRLWRSKEAAYQDIIDQTVETWHNAAASVFNRACAWTPENLSSQLEHGTFELFKTLTTDLDLTTLVLRHQLHDMEERGTYLAIYERGFDELQRCGAVGTGISAEVMALAYLALTERFFYARLLHGQVSPQQAAHEVTPLMVSILISAGHEQHPPISSKPTDPSAPKEI